MDKNATALQTAHARGRARWPALSLPVELFAKHCQRLALDPALMTTRAEDLFLVVAVLERIPRANVHFDDYLVTAAEVVGRIDRTPTFIDDVVQELRFKLLIGDEAKLGTYSGAGALMDWLRVVATRTALNLKRADRPYPAEDLAEAVLGGQEATQLMSRYLGDLRDAIELGCRRLTARERTLLRLHFIDGLNIERIGVIYRVNRTTVARWLVAIRTRLFEEVRGELGAKHGLDTADVKSIYRLMERDVHVTMSRVLAE